MENDDEEKQILVNCLVLVLKMLLYFCERHSGFVPLSKASMMKNNLRVETARHFSLP
jgi:hypothetical protein